jgi:hypothetical protein
MIDLLIVFLVTYVLTIIVCYALEHQGNHKGYGGLVSSVDVQKVKEQIEKDVRFQSDNEAQR